MKKIILLLAIIVTFKTQAQNVAVNNDASAPDNSAMLDIKSSTKGLLIPRMNSAAVNAIVNPAKGLLVLDTAKNQLMINMGTVATPSWQTIVAKSGWGLSGNSGTDSATNFIGTTDTKPLTIKVNNVRSGYIDSLNYNTAFGFRALDSFTTGTLNTAVGYYSLSANKSGGYNTGIGLYALQKNSTGSFNTATGSLSLLNNISGSQNTAFGQLAMAQNISGGQNVAAGSDALRFNTTGNSNVAIGFTSLYFNTTGYSNIAIGTGALFNTGNRSNLVAVGDSALFNNGVGAVNPVDGTANAAFGSKALFANTTGYYNTATGANALRSNSTGVQNTANGTGVLINNTIGGANTAMGLNAMFQNVIGNENTAIGNFALVANNAGSRNTGLGVGALATNSTGSNNTAIGFAADVISNNLSNATAIGYNAKVAASNSIVLGGTGADAVNVGIGITIPKARLHVADSSVVFSAADPVLATPGNPPLSGTGARTMWYAGKAAFRTGYTAGNQWDKDNMGYYSFASGISTRALGFSSTSMGSNTNAIGSASISMGEFTTATGGSSTSMGRETIASGNYSVSMGALTTAKAVGGVTIGSCNDNTDDPSTLLFGNADRVFQIGNGTSDAIRSNALTVLRNGNIGIGTVNPARPLSFPASLGEKILFYPGGAGEVGIGVYGNELRLHADNPGAKVSFGTQTNAGVFTEAGKFQISGGYALSVFGNIWANGITYNSDARFKNNIHPLEGSLKKIMQLTGVSYQMNIKDFPAKNFSEGEQAGLIAQEVEKIIPQVVSTGSDGYKAIDYAKMVPYLIEGMKEQQLQIEKQQHQIDELKKLIEENK